MPSKADLTLSPKIRDACKRIRAGWTRKHAESRMTPGRSCIREIPVPLELAGYVEAYNTG